MHRRGAACNRTRVRIATFLATLAFAGPAAAAGLRDLCPDRPGNATPPCIVDVGHIQIETAFTDWTHDRRDGIATDAFAFADTEARIGLTPRLEAEIRWQPYNIVTARDLRSGARDHAEGTGDATFSLRRSLANPGGDGFSIAVEPFVTAPIGHSGIGQSGWSGGVLLPLSIDLGGNLSFGATPEIDIAADADGSGHHASYSGVVALSRKFGAVQAGGELWINRDDDPAGHVTQATADVTLAWTATTNLQFDAGANAGLNRATPRIELYFGVTRRF